MEIKGDEEMKNTTKQNEKVKEEHLKNAKEIVAYSRSLGVRVSKGAIILRDVIALALAVAEEKGYKLGYEDGRTYVKKEVTKEVIEDIEKFIKRRSRRRIIY